MSNKTDLQTQLDRQASLIEELKGKAVGSGGTSVETCTVTLSISGNNATGAYITSVIYTTIENNSIICYDEYPEEWGSTGDNNVFVCTKKISPIKNSMIVLIDENYAGATVTVSGDIVLEQSDLQGCYTATVNGNGTITANF